MDVALGTSSLQKAAARKRPRGERGTKDQSNNHSKVSTTNVSVAHQTEGDYVDPFPCALRCKQVQDQPQVLWWHSPVPPVKMSVEEGLIDKLVPYQSKERGMFKSQPPHRLQKLRRLCGSNNRISLMAALSLRRHHMKKYSPRLNMTQLRLGDRNDINESARLFEEAVEDFLKRSNVAFYTESDQKSHIARHKKQDEPYPPTPDFILKEPLHIKQYSANGGKKRVIVRERSVCCKFILCCCCGVVSQ